MAEYDKNAVTAPYVTEWLRENIHDDDALTQELRRYAKEFSVPIAEPETARFLAVLCKIKQPKRVLEVGTAIGYSSIVMARVMPADGEILTLEYDEKTAETARENIKKAGFAERIRVVCADAKEYLSYIDGDEGFDMIFMDGPKAHYLYMLDDCIRLLKHGGVLVSDNVLFKGMTADDNHFIKRKATIVNRLREYVAALTESPELFTALLPLGDGVAVSVKR